MTSVFSVFQRKGQDALVRPLTTDDWADLEAMIALDPVAFLYAAEHLERFGLPAPSALNSYRAPFGFMGVFLPAENETLAHLGALEDAAGELAPTMNQDPLPGQQQTKNNAQLLSAFNQKLVPAVTKIAQTFKLRSSGTAEPAFPGQSEKLGQVAGVAAPSYRLVGAFWLGSNCVPLQIADEHLRYMANMVVKNRRQVASILGDQHQVMKLWELTSTRMPQPMSVRDTQPLLYLDPDHDIEEWAQRSLQRADLEAPALEAVRWSRTSDRASLFKASVAMFKEEVGYDPLERDPQGYARRVNDYIRMGRCLVATNEQGLVVFKVDIGLAHADVCQLQGVWLHPAYRGLGLSEALLAQACILLRPRFPHISLYVNDYNERARALYARIGFEQVGTFSTILF